MAVTSLIFKLEHRPKAQNGGNTFQLLVALFTTLNFRHSKLLQIDIRNMTTVCKLFKKGYFHVYGVTDDVAALRHNQFSIFMYKIETVFREFSRSILRKKVYNKINNTPLLNDSFSSTVDMKLKLCKWKHLIQSSQLDSDDYHLYIHV